jgi:hypothetical protein
VVETVLRLSQWLKELPEVERTDLPVAGRQHRNPGQLVSPTPLNNPGHRAGRKSNDDFVRLRRRAIHTAGIIVKPLVLQKTNLAELKLATENWKKIRSNSCRTPFAPEFDKRTTP